MAALQEFARFARSLKGDGESEARAFLERFFRAPGHDGVIEAGATFEFRVQKKPAPRSLNATPPDRSQLDHRRRDPVTATANDPGPFPAPGDLSLGRAFYHVTFTQ